VAWVTVIKNSWCLEFKYGSKNAKTGGQNKIRTRFDGEVKKRKTNNGRKTFERVLGISLVWIRSRADGNGRAWTDKPTKEHKNDGRASTSESRECHKRSAHYSRITTTQNLK